MARCSLGSRKLRRYSRALGMEFVKGFVRGNTDHRVDLYDKYDNCISVYPNKWKRTLDVITTNSDPAIGQFTFNTLSQHMKSVEDKDWT